MITIQIKDDQLPRLAALIAASPELAELVASKLRSQKDTYTVAEAAKKLGVTPKTIRNRIAAKMIPTVYGIGATRIPAAYIEKVLKFNHD